jgi:hypothetical protein
MWLPVRPATLWMRVMSFVGLSCPGIAGRMVVGQRANIYLPAPRGPRSRRLWTQRPHSIHPAILVKRDCLGPKQAVGRHMTPGAKMPEKGSFRESCAIQMRSPRFLMLPLPRSPA